MAPASSFPAFDTPFRVVVRAARRDLPARGPSRVLLTPESAAAGRVYIRARARARKRVRELGLSYIMRSRARAQKEMS